MAKQPMQPIVLDAQGTVRFQSNAIVRFLVDVAGLKGMDLNALAVMPFSIEDRNQLAQLIGYSVSGFGDLSYADPAIVAMAVTDANALLAVSRGTGCHDAR